jgi:F0F1-type ATP synthase gamma subunit
MGITFDSQSPTVETTVPLADGTNASISNVKFTPSTAGTYAYVYTTTKYVAPSYLNQSSGAYDSSKTYYMKTENDVYYAVAVTSAAAFAEHKAKLYIVDSSNAGAAGVYDVKVIKVQ